MIINRNTKLLKLKRMPIGNLPSNKPNVCDSNKIQTKNNINPTSRSIDTKSSKVYEQIIPFSSPQSAKTIQKSKFNGKAAGGSIAKDNDDYILIENPVTNQQKNLKYSSNKSYHMKVDYKEMNDDIKLINNNTDFGLLKKKIDNNFMQNTASPNNDNIIKSHTMNNLLTCEGERIGEPLNGIRKKPWIIRKKNISSGNILIPESEYKLNIRQAEKINGVRPQTSLKNRFDHNSNMSNRKTKSCSTNSFNFNVMLNNQFKSPIKDKNSIKEDQSQSKANLIATNYKFTENFNTNNTNYCNTDNTNIADTKKRKVSNSLDLFNIKNMASNRSNYVRVMKNDLIGTPVKGLGLYIKVDNDQHQATEGNINKGQNKEMKIINNKLNLLIRRTTNDENQNNSNDIKNRSTSEDLAVDKDDQPTDRILTDRKSSRGCTTGLKNKKFREFYDGSFGVDRRMDSDAIISQRIYRLQHGTPTLDPNIKLIKEKERTCLSKNIQMGIKIDSHLGKSFLKRMMQTKSDFSYKKFMKDKLRLLKMGASLDTDEEIVNKDTSKSPMKARQIGNTKKIKSSKQAKKDFNAQIKSKERKNRWGLPLPLWRNIYQITRIPNYYQKGENHDDQLLVYTNENFLYPNDDIDVNFYPNKKGVGIFIIFEGHGQAKNRLNRYIFDTFTHCLKTFLEFKEGLSPIVILKTIKNVYEYTKFKIMADYFVDSYTSGSSILFLMTYNGIGYTANLGGGKMIVINDYMKNGKVEFGHKTLATSHNTSNDQDCKRVIKAGGIIENIPDAYGTPVLSSPMVFIPTDITYPLNMTRIMGMFSVTGQGIISQPSIDVHEITVNERLLVMASNDFWAVFQNSHVSFFVFVKKLQVNDMIAEYQKYNITIYKENFDFSQFLYEKYIQYSHKRRNQVKPVGIIVIKLQQEF